MFSGITAGLGNLRLVFISVTEGEDKPLKYPTIFNSADLAVVTKMDLAQAVEFDWHSAYGNIPAVRPGMQVLKLSAKTAEGMEEYLNFLRARLDALRGAVAVSAEPCSQRNVSLCRQVLQ